MFDILAQKIHVRSASLCIGAFFVCLGALMVFYGIQDEGFIDFQSALLMGKLKSGFVGVSFALMGVFIVCLCILVKPVSQRIKVEHAGTVLEWEGVINSTSHLLDQMESMLTNLTASKQDDVDHKILRKEINEFHQPISSPEHES